MRAQSVASERRQAVRTATASSHAGYRNTLRTRKVPSCTTKDLKTEISEVNPSVLCCPKLVSGKCRNSKLMRQKEAEKGENRKVK